MYSLAFSILFVSFIILTLIVRFWLASRQIRHVLTHRSAVPAEFAEKIPLAAHQKAADYTIARTKLGLVSLLLSTGVLTRPQRRSHSWRSQSRACRYLSGKAASSA